MVGMRALLGLGLQFFFFPKIAGRIMPGRYIDKEEERDFNLSYQDLASKS
jgi:hypothetical protein